MGEGAAYALRPEASCGRLRYRLGRGGGEGGGALPGSGFATGHFLAAAAVPLCPATCCEHTPRPMKHCAPKVAWQPMGRGQGNKGGSYNTHLEPSPVAELRTRWGARGWMSWVSRLCSSAYARSGIGLSPMGARRRGGGLLHCHHGQRNTPVGSDLGAFAALAADV